MERTFGMGYHHLKRAADHIAGDSNSVRPTRAALHAMIESYLRERFGRASNLTPMVLHPNLSSLDGEEDPPPNPAHPDCAEYAETEYCRESWQLHLALLADRPEAHWHRCDHGLLCGLVPVMFRDHCLAVVKLVGTGSITEEDFEKQLTLLGILVMDFVRANADFGDRLVRCDEPAPQSETAVHPESHDRAGRQPDHPQVLAAIRHIEEHLCDPKLTVGSTGRALAIDSNYLSHLFAEQVAVRMSRYITARRIDLAKTLLATTHSQIKQICLECGFANPNWFCHVFRTHTGDAPGTFRRKSRGHTSDTSRE